jgi:hypothetical protein
MSQKPTPLSGYQVPLKASPVVDARERSVRLKRNLMVLKLGG